MDGFSGVSLSGGATANPRPAGAPGNAASGRVAPASEPRDAHERRDPAFEQPDVNRDSSAPPPRVQEGDGSNDARAAGRPIEPPPLVRVEPDIGDATGAPDAAAPGSRPPPAESAAASERGEVGDESARPVGSAAAAAVESAVDAAPDRRLEARRAYEQSPAAPDTAAGAGPEAPPGGRAVIEPEFGQRLEAQRAYESSLKLAEAAHRALTALPDAGEAIGITIGDAL